MNRLEAARLGRGDTVVRRFEIVKIIQDGPDGQVIVEAREVDGGPICWTTPPHKLYERETAA